MVTQQLMGLKQLSLPPIVVLYTVTINAGVVGEG